ncbi:hypothetical protein CAC42_6168 [Sphaceloma murrayae]|uniref:Telomere repeat-binding factor dimerisation domain-containing protein n=1 Tax=Sphaceloma murrayae TaxID=2082308 RepID=A0A2K1QTJ3_9PEZI|nr:hypothetical protein CAC42_6168 [Sphaceloma murrayae]
MTVTATVTVTVTVTVSARMMRVLVTVTADKKQATAPRVVESWTKVRAPQHQQPAPAPATSTSSGRGMTEVDTLWGMPFSTNPFASSSSLPGHYDVSSSSASSSSHHHQPLANAPSFDPSLYDFSHHDAAAAASSPNVNVGPFSSGQSGHFPASYQPHQLITIPSAPSLTDASPSTIYSPYGSIVPTDQGNAPVEPVSHSAISQASPPHQFNMTHQQALQDYRPSEPPSNYALPMAGHHFYSADEGYASAPVQQQPSASPSVGYGKSSEWPDAQWACEQQYNPSRSNQNIYQGTAELYGKDASLHLKLQSLAVLDNLSTQIILSLAKPSLAEIEMLAANTGDDEDSQAYHTRKNLFDQTRKVYSRDSPFIDAVAIQLFTPSQQEIIRKANRATFISSLLESHDVSFFDLNEYFLEVFVPSGQRLLKWQGAIYLELKTQVYISALLNSDGDVGALLDELFPADLEEKTIARHPDAPHLVPSEQDFVERARARKQYLQQEPAETALQSLPRKYAWQDFLREFANRSNSSTDLRRTASGTHLPRDDGRRPSPPFSTTTSPDCQRSAYASFGALLPDPTFAASHMAISHHETLTSLQGRKSSSTASDKAPAATTRQPWKQEEEDALLAGLEEVKGPYWSRILSMYGRGGSRSEVLKDRNQIQLKDKARNLKLWYLKMGNEVPACLQGVTGELRKRGGAKVRAALGLDDGVQGAAGVKKARSPKRS